MKDTKFFNFFSVPIYNGFNQIIIFSQGIYIQINFEQKDLNLWAVIVILINLSKSFNAESSQQDFYILNNLKKSGPSITLLVRNIFLLVASLFFTLYLLSFYENEIKFYIFLISLSYIIDALQSSKQSELQNSGHIYKSYLINKLGNFIGGIVGLALLIIFYEIKFIVLGFLIGRCVSLVASYIFVNNTTKDFFNFNKINKLEVSSVFNLTLPIFIGLMSRQFLDILILESGYESLLGEITIYLLILQFLISNSVIIYDRFTTSEIFSNSSIKNAYVASGLVSNFLLLGLNYLINTNFVFKYFNDVFEVKDLSILIFFYILRGNVSILFSNFKLEKTELKKFNRISFFEAVILLSLLFVDMQFNSLGDIFFIFCLAKLISLIWLNKSFFSRLQNNFWQLAMFNSYIVIYIIYFFVTL